jgi:hypothetical protein
MSAGTRIHMQNSTRRHKRIPACSYISICTICFFNLLKWAIRYLCRNLGQATQRRAFEARPDWSSQCPDVAPEVLERASELRANIQTHRLSLTFNLLKWPLLEPASTQPHIWERGGIVYLVFNFPRANAYIYIFLQRFSFPLCNH